MSERLPNTSKEAYKHHAESASTPEKHKSTAEKQETKKQPQESLEAIRKKVEKQAISQETADAEKQTHEPPAPRYITKQIKLERYKNTLRHIRKHLSPTQRRISKFIHNPVVENISEVGSKTIARPSGILGGSLIALLGSLTIIIVAKHIGFEVPNSIFWILFIIGFLLGVLIEIIFGYFKKQKAR